MVLNSWMQFVARERPILAGQRWSTPAHCRNAAALPQPVERESAL